MNPTKSLTLCGINRQNLDMMTLCSWRNKPLCAEWDWNIYLPESLNVGKYSSPIRRICRSEDAKLCMPSYEDNKEHLRDRIHGTFAGSNFCQKNSQHLCRLIYRKNRFQTSPKNLGWIDGLVSSHPQVFSDFVRGNPEILEHMRVLRVW